MFSVDIYSVQMTDILLFPVKESFRIRVSFDDRYGMYFSVSFSARAEITFPSDDRELLMNLASSSRMSTELDFLTLSEPARSIRESVEFMYSVEEIFWVT